MPESSTTLARKIALPVSPVSMKTRGQLAAQPNVWAAVLQLQRQHGNQFVQRFLRIAGSAEGDEPVTPKVERAIESNRSGGQSRDRDIQAQRGPATSADFSGVRMHTGQGADGLNRPLGAKAFTTGKDISFRGGAFQLGSSSGRGRTRHERPEAEAGPRGGLHTTEAPARLSHQLTHGVQQTSDTASATPRSSALQRKVILKGAEMPAKDRRAFLKGHRWSNTSRAAAIMEDMAAAGDAFDFADEDELKSEIDKRLSTVGHMEESQQTVEKVPGDKRAAFGYPFTGASAVYGPRVNYAAREYWEQATPDDYAERTDKAKNKELMRKPRHQRCTVYGDQCDPYIWKLSDKGKKDPYHAIAYLFVPQPPSKRALLHCDYLISLVNFMSLADSIGADEFNKRIAAFGADKIVLKTNLLMDLNVSTFERDPKGEFTKTAKKGLGSMQRVSPSSEADLVIGDHVIFYNHIAYDVINANVGNAWRLENAVLVGKDKGKDVFLGHGSGYKTADQMHEKLAEEFNKVAGMALALVAKTKSGDKKAQAAAQDELASKFSVKPVGKEWHIQGTPSLLTFFSCARAIDEKLRAIKPAEVVGLRHPCDSSKMYAVERPIESAK